MLTLFAKLLLTASAMAPVGLTYAWVVWHAGESTTAVVFLTTAIALVTAARAILNYARRNSEQFPFNAMSIETADQQNVAFLLLYLVPLVMEAELNVNLSALIPVILVVALVTATGYNYHFNPLLSLLRYHFYRVATAEGVSYVLITRKHIINAKDVTNVIHLTEYVVFDPERR